MPLTDTFRNFLPNIFGDEGDERVKKLQAFDKNMNEECLGGLFIARIFAGQARLGRFDYFVGERVPKILIKLFTRAVEPEIFDIFGYFLFQIF